MQAPKLHVDTDSSPRRRIGIRTFAVAVFAALFGLAPAAQASDRGRGGGAERGKQEAERGKERGREEAERGKRREERERSTGHDADAGGKKK